MPTVENWRASEHLNGAMKPDLSGFGSFTALRPLAGGNRNNVWLVEAADGAKWVAKSCAHGAEVLGWLAPVQAAARSSGFVVNTRMLARGGWALEPFLAGSHPDTVELARLAERLANFHRACPALSQRPDAAGCLDLLTMEVSGGIDMAALPARLRAACRAAWQTVACAPTQPIHGDIGMEIVILTPYGPALIDWDEARVDLAFLDFANLGALSAAQTLAHLAWEIASGWMREPVHARQLARTFLVIAKT